MTNLTNSKTVRSAIRQHILDSVYNENEELFTTYQDAAKHLFSDFNQVSNYPLNLKRIPNNQARFMDYMQGLPFCFCYSYAGITDFLATLDLNSKGSYTSEKSEIFYYYLIYSEMLKVVNK